MGEQKLPHQPNRSIHKQLRGQDNDKLAVLNPARAMLLEAMHRYEDDFEPVSLFVANKLVFFLKALGGPFDARVKFTRHIYGPYAPAVNHVVYHLNGSYLTGLEQNTARPFDPLRLDYERYPQIQAFVGKELTPSQRHILLRLDELLDGYKSAYALEILATVAFIRRDRPSASVDEILAEARQWSPRKAKMLRREYVEQAVERLDAYAADMFTSWQ